MPPAPLSSRQKAIVIALSLVAAATRLAALSRAPWEWDEILFASAMREYDVVLHHPHPPGSPLFIAAARVIGLSGASDFHALQIVVVIGAMLLFPLTFTLGRELRLGFGAAAGGALLVVFAPNVWYYGGTTFSDVPGLALVLGSSTLLLRGMRSPAAWLAGCALLGVAIGFRPQLLLVPALPFAAAAWSLRRSARGTVIVGAAVVAAIAAGSYAGAAAASASPRRYVDAVREQQAYVARVDSFRSPTRPSLVSLTRTFFKPTRGGGDVDKVLVLLAAAGALTGLYRRDRGVLLLLAMFTPLALLSWVMLDLNAASRYVIGYVPLFALLAAYALAAIARRESVAVVVCAAASVWFGVSAWPSLRVVRSEEPPLVRALRAVEAEGRAQTIYTTPGVLPFAVYYLEESEIVDLTAQPVEGDGLLVVDALSAEPCARNFIRPRERLDDIGRARYFEASVAPLAGCQ